MGSCCSRGLVCWHPHWLVCPCLSAWGPWDWVAGSSVERGVRVEPGRGARTRTKAGTTPTRVGPREARAAGRTKWVVWADLGVVLYTWVACGGGEGEGGNKSERAVPRSPFVAVAQCTDQLRTTLGGRGARGKVRRGGDATERPGVLKAMRPMGSGWGLGWWEASRACKLHPKKGFGV